MSQREEAELENKHTHTHVNSGILEHEDSLVVCPSVPMPGSPEHARSA